MSMYKAEDMGLKMQWALEGFSMGSRIFDSSLEVGLFTLTKWSPSLKSCQVPLDVNFCNFQLELDETHGPFRMYGIRHVLLPAGKLHPLHITRQFGITSSRDQQKSLLYVSWRSYSEGRRASGSPLTSNSPVSKLKCISRLPWLGDWDATQFS